MELSGEVVRLRAELEAACAQRDLLLCEVASLRRELRLASLHDDSVGGKCEEEEGGGGAHGYYRQAAPTQPRLARHDERGYMDAHRYAAAQVNLSSGLNHSNSSCSSGSAASSAPALGSEPAPLYIAAPPDGFGITLHNNNNRRGTDIIGGQQLQQKDAPVSQKRGKFVRGRYEMSQDLLEKQTEILERRYGGLRARRAAVTLQRAFRRRQLARKFSAITAMAKAADSARRPLEHEYAHLNGNDNVYQGALMESTNGSDRGLALTRPMRSMSLRERGDAQMMHGSPGAQESEIEEMAARVQHEARQLTLIGRVDTDSGVCSCSVGGSATNISTSSHNDSAHHHLALMNNTGPIYSNLMSTGGRPVPSPTAKQQQQLLALQARRPPPEVPKRSSSITLSNSESPVSMRRAECAGAGGEASHCARDARCHRHYRHMAQDQHYHQHQRTPSGNVIYDNTNERYEVWKRQADANAYYETAGAAPCEHAHHHRHEPPAPLLKVSETVRKRQYRVGLNLFNKKPERGVAYLMARGFLENSPRGVARFLITRKGLSKQMIGEYLGNLQSPFNMAVLECFVNELDLSGMAVDVALRRYQAHFRLPGEAQKIERLVEAFARRYCACNPDFVQRLRTRDTIFVLAFAIIMLNTDLHTPNLKPEARMSVDDFIKNLRGIDDCGDMDRETLAGIYERVKSAEFRAGSDHVTQVMKVQATIVGKKPQLALPHRRLVCYCRLYEIPDLNRKERPGLHQREVFLFNDLLVITKIFSKKKSSVTYSFRQSFPLCGMSVGLFSVAHYPFGIRLSRRVDGRCLATFNARNEHDRCKFAEDLRESVAEMDEMESMRIEAELNRGKGRTGGARTVLENRDSGVADVEIDQQTCPMDHIHHMHGAPVPPPPSCPAPPAPRGSNPPPTCVMKRNVLSNSLVDINESVALAAERMQRRGSVGSLDSGMSVSFSRPASRAAPNPSPQPRRQFLGGIFPMRQRKLSAPGVDMQRNSGGKSTEV